MCVRRKKGLLVMQGHGAPSRERQRVGSGSSVSSLTLFPALVEDRGVEGAHDTHERGGWPRSFLLLLCGEWCMWGVERVWSGPGRRNRGYMI